MADENNQVKIDQVSVDDAPSPENDAVATLTAQIAELNDKYLRIAAELENTRRRAAIDADAAARNRAMNIAGKILPVMDAVDAALKHTPDDAGIQSMARALSAAFEQIGITKMTSIGMVLNPQIHNAIQVIDAPADADPKPAPNTIVDEMQAGYMFGDNVLRPAMVVVCR